MLASYDVQYNNSEWLTTSPGYLAQSVNQRRCENAASGVISELKDLLDNGDLSCSGIWSHEAGPIIGAHPSWYYVRSSIDCAWGNLIWIWPRLMVPEEV
jgi:hypothetical protein